MANITNSRNNTIISGKSGNDVIGNYGSKVTINGGAGNDAIGVMSNKKHVFQCDYGNGNDWIYGFNSNDTLQINAYSYSTLVSGNDFIVFVGTGSFTLKNSANISVKIKDAYGNLRTCNSNPTNILNGSVLNDEIINTTDNAVVLGWDGNDSIINFADKAFISGDYGDDIVFSRGSGISITASEGNDSLKSTGNNCGIMGFEGNDTIVVQGKGNTVIGGFDDDIIFEDSDNGGNLIEYGYGCGNDIIYGFKTNDTLNLYSGYVTKVSVSGSNVIAKVGNDTITGINLKGKIINMTDWADGNYSVRVDSANSITLFATNKTTANMELNSAVKNFDASSRTKAVKITGNALANTISGGSKNDSLYGGAGNDTLYGDAGKDVFIYANGEGKDVIYGFENNDMLKITGTFSASYNKSKKEIYFKVGSTKSAITLNDFTASTFNVNGTNYKISGSKLVKK